MTTPMIYVPDKQFNNKSDNTTKFINKTTNMGFGGTNKDINSRLTNTFNQWTRNHDDSCSYVNEMRVLRKPLKYYTSVEWAPSPTNKQPFTTFTAIGNQKQYFVSNNLTYPSIGEPTSMGNKKFIQNVMPLNTTPFFGANSTDTNTIDISSNQLAFGIGELTNKRDLTKDITSSQDYNRWDFVDSHIVQNSKNIIFANGVIPVGGISTRNELQNFSNMNGC
jgi:hypothetical protein